nr:DUF952 domain-containing protein [Anaerolineae bacterium]
FYIGQSDLVLLCVDVARLTGELRYEPSADHLQDSLFPHLYGPLNLAAVVSVVLFPAGPDGRFTLPPDIP